MIDENENELVLALDLDNLDGKLPSLYSYTNWKMYNDRRIWMDDEINLNVLDYERLILQFNIDDEKNNIPVDQRKPIWIYLMNYGGSADLTWSLVDLIISSKTPIYTVNMGVCASAASIIFITGHKRYMMPGATVLIHEGEGQFNGDATKVFDNVEAYKKMIKRMNEYIISKTKISKQMMSRKKNNDWIIEAKECKEYGVCDTIVSTITEIL